MANLGGRPVLAWVVSALEAAPGVDRVVIATSTLPQDDVIEEWCRAHRVCCFRGSESDVLDRFYRCAVTYDADVVLRLTCDCPWLDPQVVGQVIQLRAMTGAAYCSNNDPPSWPDGLDTECFTFKALETAWNEAIRETDRDTVTQFIIRNRDRFPAESVVCPFPGMNSERWVLDTKADYELCTAIALKWGKNTPPSCTDILKILDDNPGIRDLNKGGIRNERFYQGLAGEVLPIREYPRSTALLARATATIPCGSQTYSKSHVHFPAGNAPLYVSHGDGARVFDVDGHDYVDLVGALLPVVLGYRDPDVDHAVRRQINSGYSFSLATKLEAELAEKLCHLIPCAEAVRFGKTGTDVTTAAVRLARACTGNYKVLVGGYHGWADWSMAIDANKLGIPAPIRDLTDYFTSFGDLMAALRSEYTPAAIVIECNAPIATPGNLKWLREHCDKNNILLIFDEIKTGFRVAMGGIQSLYGVTPDLACFGKAMGNGVPISALVGKASIMNRFADDVFYSGTFFGDTIGLAAALATIKKMEDHNVIQHLYDVSERINYGLQQGGLKGEVDFTGVGNITTARFRDPDIKALYIQEMAQFGVLTLGEHGVSYAFKDPEVDRVILAYKHTLDIIRDCVKNPDQIHNHLRGKTTGKPLRKSA